MVLQPFDEHVCDGSSALRLAVMARYDIARESVGHAVMEDNGSIILLIRGDCQAWLKTPDTWAETRRVSLDAGAADALFDALSVKYWHALSGSYASQAFDAPTWLFATPASAILCRGGCLAEPAPEKVRGIATAAVVQIQSLYASGLAVDGGVRYSLVREGVPTPDVTGFLWPVDDPSAGSVALSPSDLPSYGTGHLVTDPQDVGAFRDLRRQYLDGVQSKQVGHLPVVDDAGVTYRLYVRDALPFESDAGLVASPGSLSLP